jgi:hypothetical protein
VNLVESHTSSNVTPIEPSSAETAEAKELKEEGEFTVSKSSRQIFLMAGGNDMAVRTAFKCSGCQLLTLHIGKELVMYDALGELPDKPNVLPEVRKRILGCTNCGKFSTK